MNRNTVIACAPVEGPLLLPDNLIAPCAECGCMVQYRPHAPKGARKVCIECVIPFIDRNNAKLTTTTRMIADYRRYLRSKLQ